MLRVLHVASFQGNIGDNANHAGFRPWFERLAGAPVQWANYEIREVYRGNRRFDCAFADEANRHDIVIVGGGNYFELWVENSPTGTSFSITDDALDALKAPVFFNALGVDAGQGVPTASLERFNRFLQRVLSEDRFFLSVRNDGALSTLQTVARGVALDKVVRLPDAGFFAPYPKRDRRLLPDQPPTIGINLAGDMLEKRFPGGASLDYPGFIREFAHVMAEASRLRQARFRLFPHIFRDITVYGDLLGALPDALRREACRIEAYDAGDAAAADVFGAYAGCDLVLGMRFHANVVAIGLGVPAIGLGCYDQIRLLYDELGAPGHVVDVQKTGFANPLLEAVCRSLGDRPAALDRTQALLARVQAERQSAERALIGWMRRQGLAR